MVYRWLRISGTFFLRNRGGYGIMEEQRVLENLRSVQMLEIRSPNKRDRIARPNQSRGADARIWSTCTVLLCPQPNSPGLLKHAQKTGSDFPDMPSWPTQ